MSLESRWIESLNSLRSQGRYRTLTAPQGLDFSSNDYLGYANGRLPIVADTSLSSSGAASRLLRGNHELWEQVESELAAWHGAEAALMFPSGYSANEGLLSTVIGRHDVVFSDRLNHASIVDGLSLSCAKVVRFKHNDLSDLASGGRQPPVSEDDSRNRGLAPPARLIVTESLFSMDGDRSPLAEFANIPNTHLIVDEAHATGCLGPRGSGLVDSLGLRSYVLATMHTGGKALGVPGAYVVGSKLMKEYLLNKCRHFIFTTALPPIIADFWLKAIRRVQNDDEGRERLRHNARFFRNAAGLPEGDYIVPIIIGDDSRAVAKAQELQAAGFDVRAIRPPTVPEGTARLRISIHADHTEEQLKNLANLVKS